MALLQVLCSLSSEAVLAVLSSSPASLHQQLAQLPEELHGYAIQEAFPSLPSDGVLVLDSNQHPTSTLTAILHHTASLPHTTHLIWNSAALRCDHLDAVALQPFEDALQAAVRGNITKLTLQGCSMPPECLRRLLCAAYQNSSLQSLSICLSSSPGLLQGHGSSSSRDPHDVFTSKKVMKALGRLTCLRALVLRTSGDSQQPGQSDVVASRHLCEALIEMTLLTHLDINHHIPPAEAAKILAQHRSLHSLAVLCKYEITQGDMRPIADQVDAANSITGGIRGDSHDLQQMGQFCGSLLRHAHMQELSVVMPQELHFQSGLLVAVAKMPRLNSLSVSQLGAADNVQRLVTAICSMPFGSLRKLRLDGAFTDPRNVHVSFSACVQLCQLVVNLPALVDLGIQFNEPFDSEAIYMGDRLMARSRGLQSLKSLHLNSRMGGCNGRPIFAAGIAALCIPQSLHTLTVSLEASQLSPDEDRSHQHTYAWLTTLLKHQSAADSMQHLCLSIKHRPVQSAHVLQDCLTGLTRLTVLSLDLWCEDHCVQHLFPHLKHLSNLESLCFAISGEPEAFVMFQENAAMLSSSLSAMRKLRDLRLAGWTFRDGCLGVHLGPVFAEMTQLAVLDLSCGEASQGSSISALAVFLRGNRCLRKLVTGDWNIDEESAGKLSGVMALHVRFCNRKTLQIDCCETAVKLLIEVASVQLRRCSNTVSS